MAAVAAVTGVAVVTVPIRLLLVFRFNVLRGAAAMKKRRNGTRSLSRIARVRGGAVETDWLSGKILCLQVNGMFLCMGGYRYALIALHGTLPY